jgi:hypothetical protein
VDLSLGLAAVKYSNSNADTVAPPQLLPSTGIRGAPLGARVAWLSQFPYEREVVFPPGTRFQVLAPPRTDPPPPLTAPGFFLRPPYPLPAHHVAIDAPPPPTSWRLSATARASSEHHARGILGWARPQRPHAL